MARLLLTTTAAGVRVIVQVQPRASRTELAGVHDGAVKVRLQAPPVDGAANEALVDFLAGVLRVKRRDVRVIAGATSRRKVVEVAGPSAAEVESLLGARGEG